MSGHGWRIRMENLREADGEQGEMSEFEKATPRPWRVGSYDHCDQLMIDAENGRLIAICCHEAVGGLIPEMEANARLIVAAVNERNALRRGIGWALDLLDGCWIEGAPESPDDRAEAARKALRKLLEGT